MSRFQVALNYMRIEVGLSTYGASIVQKRVMDLDPSDTKISQKLVDNRKQNAFVWSSTRHLHSC